MITFHPSKFIAPIVLVIFSAFASAQTDVLTVAYSNYRTGSNLTETILNQGNVNTDSFGKISTRAVDGAILSEPLIANGVTVGSTLRNVVYVTTANLSVYAFDADDFTQVTPLWKASLGPTIAAVPSGALTTPAIDRSTNTIYILARTVSGPTNVGSSFAFNLWALDLGTGQPKFGSPVPVTASAPGTGDLSVNGIVSLDAQHHQQRTAMLISNGTLYVGFGSDGDHRPYHGWFLAYNDKTLQQTGAFCTTPNSAQGGFWMAGMGPCTDDSGNVYVGSANSIWNDKGQTLGNSVIKFSGAGTLGLLDWFTPYNVAYLNQYDLDLGCSGPCAIPNSNYILSGCKQGKLYLLNQNSLGHLATSDASTLQTVQASEGEIHNTPLFYGTAANGLIFVEGEDDYVRSFTFTNGVIQPAPQGTSAEAASDGSVGMSANGFTPGSAVLWNYQTLVGDESMYKVPGVLRAFNPNTMQELWDSNMVLSDYPGRHSHFTYSTVANGKVYVPSADQLFNTYGLLGQTPPQPPQGLLATPGNKVNRLFWQLNPNTTSFTVLRSTSATGPFTVLGTTTTNSFIDTTAVTGKYSYYEVVASNPAGNSPASSIVDASASSKPVGTTVSFPNFTSTTGLTLNGNANVANGILNLTAPGASGVGSAYYLINASAFRTNFQFTLSGSGQGGLTFTVQNEYWDSAHGNNALGGSGAELGYGPDPETASQVGNSVAIKFVGVDPTFGTSSVGFLQQGQDAGSNSVSLASSGMYLASGHTFNVSVVYDGVTLSYTLTDTVTGNSYSQSLAVSIIGNEVPQSETLNMRAGFTGSANLGCEPEILNWSVTPY